MPTTVSKKESERLLKFATYASITTAGILIITKLGAYWLTGSVSILASLVDSFMDPGASLVNLLAVSYALAPPDKEHRFGHGKAESLAGLAQATFIAGSGLFLILEAVQRLVNPQPLQDVGVGVGVMIFSIIASLILVRIQYHVIKKTNSTAIRADSLHYKTDLLNNGAIIVALLLAGFNWPIVDPLFALAIAGYILYSAWGIGYEALQDLLDHELPDDKRQLIIQIARDHPKVIGMHDLRTRLSGRTQFIQLHLELPDHLTLTDAHAIAADVEKKIMQAIPGADVVIHQDPTSSVDINALPIFKRNP